MKTLRRFLLCSCLLLIALHLPARARASEAVKQVMDAVVSRFYETMDAEALRSLDDQKLRGLLSKDELRILATEYLTFDVNAPVFVYVMRDKTQKTVPFWIEEAGFRRTDLSCVNEICEYEVWKKAFAAGRVGLGINGFDRHRTHYFVSVSPQEKGVELKIANLSPAEFSMETMDVGSLVYHDWTELVLAKVPQELRGGVLLSTIRGRSREAHLIGAFRETPHPSSKRPDQIMLTWSRDPRSTQTIQWRTSPDVASGIAQYWKQDGENRGEVRQAATRMSVMDDRLLMNDRRVHRFEAVLEGLEPGTQYGYRVGCDGAWSEDFIFSTAPKAGEPFSFAYLGDTHATESWGERIRDIAGKHPEAAFCMMAGDLVGTGLYRNEWDVLLHRGAGFIERRPLVPSIGNHDDQECLGADMYLKIFGLPENGPDSIEKERAYSFAYGNAQFIALDVTSPEALQHDWLEKTLSESNAAWRFAMFHFPPFGFESEEYAAIRKEWCALFDQYHVDLVMCGHTHHYMRTLPIRNGKVAPSPKDGTIYVTSCAVPGRRFPALKTAEMAEAFFGESLYQIISIAGNRMEYRCFDAEGKIRDSFTIQK
ncbi:MAG TPA: metallophosphoesterase family protein [Candidatus Brocadiia bacterium]|nr:metallophosphoesterase family protein [Candidatus Brocadiia bacterium]